MIRKKTFWITIYNALYLIITKETIDHNVIIKLKRIKIACSLLSLNDIEHGILRESKFKMSFGEITNPFYSDFTKTLAINGLDYRIHFAIRSMGLKTLQLIFTIAKKLKNI